ncbi:uncharacterized protein LOC136086427 [Hydra vulgaris]|uniref:Uncharacterized protein LOC136086427 n=1 Tax=Hydra vulgaris TaxID=6087 RepID=A0ABM4CSC1_HYDVU
MLAHMRAHICDISKTTAIDYFWKWVDVMYLNLNFLIKMQDRMDIYKTIPPVFKAKFPRLTCIIDYFEIFIESPQCLLARAKCYSQYKKHCTVKVMISCTPFGAVDFLSQCWGGRVLDNHFVRDSNFHLSKYHMPRDQLLADRGFTLADNFAAGSGAELFVPASLKEKINCLQGVLPFRTVKSIKDETMNETLSSCDKIVSVCASLVNLDTSII